MAGSAGTDSDHGADGCPRRRPCDDMGGRAWSEPSEEAWLLADVGRGPTSGVSRSGVSISLAPLPKVAEFGRGGPRGRCSTGCRRGAAC